MLKQYCEEVGLALKAGTIHCYCISQHMTGEALQKSLHAYINRARLIPNKVNISSREL